MKKALSPANPPQDQKRFSSPVTTRQISSPSLAGLPPTVSMVGYTGVRHSGVLRAFPDPAVLNVGKQYPKSI